MPHGRGFPLVPSAVFHVQSPLHISVWPQLPTDAPETQFDPAHSAGPGSPSDWRRLYGDLLGHRRRRSNAKPEFLICQHR